jgi:uracil-DNA glycosylase
MDFAEDDMPQSLRHADFRARRRNMLSAPHMAPLAAFAAELRTRLPGDVPDFDPLDGGIKASVLFLFEKPGPMTDATRKGKSGSGFISRNNDDLTAKATHAFMNAAGIPRFETILWNLIPWWDGHIRFTGSDRTTALRELDRLLDLLPRLHTVVLVGRTAQKARDQFRDLRVVESPHPSPKVRATNRAQWDLIAGMWAGAWSPFTQVF